MAVGYLSDNQSASRLYLFCAYLDKVLDPHRPESTPKKNGPQKYSMSFERPPKRNTSGQQVDGWTAVQKKCTKLIWGFSPALLVFFKRGTHYFESSRPLLAWQTAAATP